MSTKYPELPRNVQPKGRWYYLLRADGEKRIWTKLTLIQAGIPALYQKLREVRAKDVAPDLMPMLTQAWLTEVCATHKDTENDEWAVREISEAFAEFRAREVTTPACITFLKKWSDKGQRRTHNLMRHALLDMMRFAEGKETDGVPWREPNTNPVASIKRLSTPARDRYPTDSEVRRIKFAAMVGRPDRWGYRTRNRSGPMLAALIDLAYLTGQRVGDLLELRWNKKAAMDDKGDVVAPYVAAEGLYFKPSKTAGTTGAKVLITWTPRLKAVMARIDAIGRKHLRYVITNTETQPLLYSTFATAWWRACDRAGIKGLHFHDLRAKAITDTEEAQGIKDAQTKGAHSTEKQTLDYVRRRKAQKTEATR